MDIWGFCIDSLSELCVLTGVVMVEAKAVVDDKKTGKKLKEVKRGKRKWAAIGAMVVLVVAIAIKSKHAHIHKSCQCSQVLFSFFFL